MTKSDHILRRTTIAAIKRHAMLPHKWDHTQFYETETVLDLGPIERELAIDEGELPVASVIKSGTDWSFVTTRKVILMTEGQRQEIKITEIETFDWGQFKDTKSTSPVIELKNSMGQLSKFTIETGKASMVMIYAIRTLTQLTRVVNKNVG